MKALQKARYARTAGTIVATVALILASRWAFTLQAAQQPAPARPSTEQAATPVVSLKVTVVISRFNGERKTGSLPFTLWVNANDRNATSLRMGEEVAVPTTTFKAGDGTATPVTSYNYRRLGTSIDCSAVSQEGGRYRLDLTVDDSAVFGDAQAGLAMPATKGLPNFQSFTSITHPVLADGQTVEFTTATDKITGEQVRVQVSLEVIK